MHFWHVLESIFSGPFLAIKQGKFWHFWAKCRRQIGLMPYITLYIYMYIHRFADKSLRICIYIYIFFLFFYMPITSFGGLFGGFKMSETEGDKKNQGKKAEKAKKKKRPKHEVHPPFGWVSCGGDFYYKIGDILRFWSQPAHQERFESYIYIYIYIYMLWCYYLGQVWPFEVLLSGPSLPVYKTLFVKKNTINIGVSALFFWKKIARANLRCFSGPSWPFLSCSQLGPDNNTYLAQIMTPQNAFFSIFCF